MSAQRIGFLDPVPDDVRVKTGFSWPAFFCGLARASAKKLWRLLFLLRLVRNAWWRRSLLRRGYRPTGVSHA